ncbi:oligosaccharide flippase family protein, partial [Parabacteroides sp.]
MSNIKKNTAYSAILTTANYIFPLIIYPYISRVLGVTNIGICNFVDSIINYFTLFAMMGINTVAIREVACCKNDKVRLSKVFSSLFLLNLVTTVIMIGLLIASIYLVPEFREYKKLMYIGTSKLLFNALLIEWLYKGLEKFRYITIRTILVRCAYVVSVFLFVRRADDYPIYYALLSSIIIIN